MLPRELVVGDRVVAICRDGSWAGAVILEVGVPERPEFDEGFIDPCSARVAFVSSGVKAVRDACQLQPR